jgi:ribonuclease HI
LKIKLFTWLSVEDKILTWENLLKKGWEGPSFCPLCSGGPDSVKHLFIYCSFTLQVWQKLYFAFQINTLWEGDSLSDYYATWIKNEWNFRTLPALVCWCIWLERNKKIFENVNPSIQLVFQKAFGLQKSAEVKDTRRGKGPRIHKTPPLTIQNLGWFDGAAQENGTLSGAGGVITVNEDTSYKWTFNCGPGTNTRAELLGAWVTLSLAVRLGIDHIHIFGDSKVIIEWLNGRGNLNAYALLGWMNMIKALKKLFKNISFDHIYREQNMIADALSKKALKAPEGLITYNKWIEGHEGPSYNLQLY